MMETFVITCLMLALVTYWVMLKSSFVTDVSVAFIQVLGWFTYAIVVERPSEALIGIMATVVAPAMFAVLTEAYMTKRHRWDNLKGNPELFPS